MDSNQSWLLVRVSSRIGYASVGTLAGWLVGQYTSFPVTLAVVGCALAFIQSTVDTWRGQLLLEWLRTPNMAPPVRLQHLGRDCLSCAAFAATA